MRDIEKTFLLQLAERINKAPEDKQIVEREIDLGHGKNVIICMTLEENRRLNRIAFQNTTRVGALFCSWADK